MNNKKNLFITFNNMTEAVRMEALFSRNGIEGELVPTPRYMSGSCAYSWKMNSREKQLARKLINRHSGVTKSWVETP